MSTAAVAGLHVTLSPRPGTGNPPLWTCTASVDGWRVLNIELATLPAALEALLVTLDGFVYPE